MSNLKFGDTAEAEVVSGVRATDGFRLRSVWEVEHWRDGNLLSKTTDHNLVTNEGIDAILDIMFHGDTAEATWYVAIVEASDTPLATWTYDLFADSLTTECEAYDEATREEYVEAAASSQVTTNSASKAAFTMNATKTIYGAGLVSNSTKGHHVAGDYLFSYSKFAVAKAVVSGDTLNVTITITGAEA